MNEEIRTAMNFIKEAEKAIGELPTTVKMVAITKYAELLKQTKDGDTVILSITNPKTKMGFATHILVNEIV